MRPRNRQRGFSVLELIIVVMLLLIIAAFATPALLRAIRSYQTESAARRLASMITSARYESMRRNRRVCTLFQRVSNEGRFGLDLVGSDKDPCDDGTRTLGANEPFMVTGTTIEWFSTDTNTKTTDFGGLPAGYDSSSEIDAPANYTITFSPRGTLAVLSGGSWVVPSNVQTLQLRRLSGGTDVDRVLVTVTPVGRVKLYRWDYVGNRWNEM